MNLRCRRSAGKSIHCRACILQKRDGGSEMRGRASKRPRRVVRDVLFTRSYHVLLARWACSTNASRSTTPSVRALCKQKQWATFVRIQPFGEGGMQVHSSWDMCSSWAVAHDAILDCLRSAATIHGVVAEYEASCHLHCTPSRACKAGKPRGRFGRHRYSIRCHKCNRVHLPKPNSRW